MATAHETNSTDLKKTYVSFLGTFNVPNNSEELHARFALQWEEVFEGRDSAGDDIYRDVTTGFRENLSYQAIGGKDSLTVYLATIDAHTAHLVASCPQGGWSEETFVFLENGNPVKAADDFNPNPIEQLL
jgi:hypothetical protein